MTIKTITVGSDYTTMPGGRYRKHGEYSGEDFRETVLVPGLRENDQLIVNLDGAKTYMNSFLEEAFGGLVREGYFSYEDLQKKLVVQASEPRYAVYLKMVSQNLIDEANRAAGKKANVA